MIMLGELYFLFLTSALVLNHGNSENSPQYDMLRCASHLHTLINNTVMRTDATVIWGVPK